MNTLELAHKLAEVRELVDEAIVKNCPVPVFYADKDGKWCRVNEPMEKLLAVANDDLLAFRWQAFVKAGKKEWDAAIRSKQDAAKLRLKLKAVDGREISVYVSLIRLSNGGYIGFVLPICEHPTGCPVHGFLLHNIESSESHAAQVRG
jgi:PAS domain-containing protein